MSEREVRVALVPAWRLAEGDVARRADPTTRRNDLIEWPPHRAWGMVVGVEEDADLVAYPRTEVLVDWVESPWRIRVGRFDLFEVQVPVDDGGSE